MRRSAAESGALTSLPSPLAGKRRSTAKSADLGNVFSSLGCETDGWIVPLSGQTSIPSPGESGRERWMQSWLDFLASRFPWLEGGGEPRTPVTSGQRSGEPLARYDLISCSWRTSQGWLIPLEANPLMPSPSLATLPTWGMTQDGALYQLETWEPRTGGIGGSVWPTPDAGVSTRNNKSLSPGATVRPLLAHLVRLWPTPQREEMRRRGPSWARKKRPGTSLVAAVETQWSTPTSRDWKDGTSPTEKVPTAGLLGRQAPRSGVGGEKSSESTLNSRLRLNSLFVEWLMGLPIDWTDCKPWATP